MFIAKTLYKWPETGTGGLIDPLGTEDLKSRGVENLAPPVNSHTAKHYSFTTRRVLNSIVS